jgi:Spy/CpxP family protein refolding chaperone
MKTSLKILLAVISLTLVAAVTPARAAADKAPANKERPNKEQAAKPDNAFNRLQEQLQPLNLTEEQKAKVDAIVQESEKTATEIRNELQAKVQELRQTTLTKIREVLTPEQAAQFGKHSKGKGKNKPKAAAQAEDAVTP